MPGPSRTTSEQRACKRLTFDRLDITQCAAMPTALSTAVFGAEACLALGAENVGYADLAFCEAVRVQRAADEMRAVINPG